jgi:Holliday junction resolvase RusA-like endonuclease
VRKVIIAMELPPTSNNIYFNVRGKGRRLTTEARSWKKKAIGRIVREAGLGFQNAFDENARYWLELAFFFESIVNKGWDEFYVRGPKKGQRKAKTKWVKMDISNRVKLVEDAVKAATGVDDSATFVHILAKDVDKKNPRVEITFLQMAEDDG